ncbi:MAG TPA: response regulator transcription factor [Prolixibacteraceae bacterium]|nr:response regulator transcription factor [Prolixibacteraceae bacterium]
MNTNKIDNVIIADSQYLVVEALKSLIGIDERYFLAGIADTQNDLYKLLDNAKSGILITDFSNIDYDGLEGLKNIREKFPQISILILTNTITKTEFAGLTRVGIKNMIYKSADKEEIFNAIESTLKGKKYYSDEILDLFLDLNENRYAIEDPKHLTSSEIEIVKLIADGLTTKEIAARRNISYHTVNTHRKNIFRKLEVSNASELTMHAIKSGWIENIEYYI